MAYSNTPPEHDTPCRVDPDLFYPEDDDYTTTQIETAKEACDNCWFKVRCRELGEHERHGVWGGTTPAERGFCI